MKSWHELLMLHLTGELAGDDQAAFERFLAEDATCRAELAEWQTLADAIRTETAARAESLPPLPASFYQRVANLATLSQWQNSGSGEELNDDHSSATTEICIGNLDCCGYRHDRFRWCAVVDSQHQQPRPARWNAAGE